MIGFAAAMTLVTLMKPRWLPPVFLRPVMLLDPFVVPAVAVAAAVLPLRLDRGEFALIMALCGAYFALAAAVPSAGHRLPKIYGARLTMTIAASAWAWHLTGTVTWGLVTAGSLLALQSVVTAACAATLQRWCPGRGGERHWRADSFCTFGAQLLMVVLMLLPVRGSQDGLLLWAVLASVATGMVIAVKAGGAAEWAPPAALATGIIAGAQLGPWLDFNILAAGTLFWAVRSAGTRSPLRPRFILSARIAGTLAVPVLTDAVMEGNPEGLAAAIFALSLALVLQQLASAAAEQAGAAVLAPLPTLVGFTAAGIAAIVALSVTDTTAGNLLLASALVVQLVASLATGTVLFPRLGLGVSWRPTAAEACPWQSRRLSSWPPTTGVSLGLGNGVLLIVVLYLALGPAINGGHPAVGLLVDGQGCGNPPVGICLWAAPGVHRADGSRGQEISLATVVIVALGIQLVFPLTAAVRDRAPDAVVADVALVLMLQTVTLAAAVILPHTAAAAVGGTWDWQRTLTITAMALSAAASGYVFRDLAAAAAFAPSMLAVLLVAAVTACPTSNFCWASSRPSAPPWLWRWNRVRRRVPTLPRPAC